MNKPPPIPEDLRERYDGARSGFRYDSFNVVPLIERIARLEQTISLHVDTQFDLERIDWLAPWVLGMSESEFETLCKSICPACQHTKADSATFSSVLWCHSGWEGGNGPCACSASVLRVLRVGLEFRSPSSCEQESGGDACVYTATKESLQKSKEYRVRV